MTIPESVVKEAMVRYSIISKITNNQDIYQNLNPKKITDLILKVMVLIEKFNTTKSGVLFDGPGKKRIVFDIVSDIIKKSEIPESVKQETHDTFTNVFDKFVESIVDVSKNKFDINNTAPKLLSFFTKCFGF